MRLNVETTLAMIRDPRLSPERALDDWCRRQYGPTAGPRMARIVAASHDCVRGILYVGAFAENHRGWKPHLNITRDDTIGGGKYREMETIYAEVKDRLDAVFAEKRAAVTRSLSRGSDLDFRFQISDFRFQISDFRFRISDFRVWFRGRGCEK